MKTLLVAAAFLTLASTAQAQIVIPAHTNPPHPCERVAIEYNYRRAYLAENQRLVLLYTASAGNGMSQYFKAWYAAMEQAILDSKAIIAVRLRAPECFPDFLSVEPMKTTLADVEQKFAAANEAAKREGLR